MNEIVEKKLKSLEQAVEQAMNLRTEGERICAIVDLCKGYVNPYNEFEQQAQREGYDECRHGLSLQRNKIKRLVERQVNINRKPQKVFASDGNRNHYYDKENKNNPQGSYTKKNYNKY